MFFLFYFLFFLDSSDKECAHGLYCDEISFTCSPLAPNGAYCTQNSHCASDWCDYDSKTCIGKKKEI
jgi:hypothetical protein